jgi:hypothetical protein
MYKPYNNSNTNKPIELVTSAKNLSKLSLRKENENSNKMLIDKPDNK